MTSDHRAAPGSLLSSDDPDPIVTSNPAGRSSFLLLGDHAGISCPVRLGDLGVSRADWARHIACDHGVAALGERLSVDLDAPFIHQAYSRLVIDCNRDPDHAESIPLTSDGTAIPGNAGLTPAERSMRIAEIHEPYHRAIAQELGRGILSPRIVTSLHSFTPVWNGLARPWRAGVLYGGGIEWFARNALARLRHELGATVGDNEPYAMDDTDYTIPRHAIANGHAYVELEIRQDCLASADDVAAWSDRLARIFGEAMSN